LVVHLSRSERITSPRPPTAHIPHASNLFDMTIGEDTVQQEIPACLLTMLQHVTCLDQQSERRGSSTAAAAAAAPQQQQQQQQQQQLSSVCHDPHKTPSGLKVVVAAWDTSVAALMRLYPGNLEWSRNLEPTVPDFSRPSSYYMFGQCTEDRPLAASSNFEIWKPGKKNAQSATI